MEGTYKGNDKLILGLVLGIITYWLFAQALLNTVPDIQKDLGMDVSTIGIGISITALFSGIFVVVAGGFVDRFGAVKLTVIGLVLSIVGSGITYHGTQHAALHYSTRHSRIFGRVYHASDSFNRKSLL